MCPLCALSSLSTASLQQCQVVSCKATDIKCGSTALQELMMLLQVFGVKPTIKGLQCKMVDAAGTDRGPA